MTLHQAKQFTVDSHGAYVTSLVDSEGVPILFERTMIGDKRRGGNHICLPYFGADAAGVLPQHGFGRDVEWETEVLESGREITCYYEEIEDGISTGFSARLLHSLDESGDSFHTSLLIHNRHERKGPFSVTPGFHPYFAVDSGDVVLNGEKVNLKEFEPYKNFPDTQEVTIESAGRTVKVWSDNLRHMIVWTDLKGEYLCVEPTHSGHSFNSTEPGKNVLQYGDSAMFSYQISWG